MATAKWIISIHVANLSGVRIGKKQIRGAIESAR